MSTFLGNDISINHDKKTLHINQNRYIAKILHKFNIHNLYKPVQTPGGFAFGDLIVRVQSRDAFAAAQREAVLAGSAGQEWSIGERDLLLCNGAIYIPNDPALRNELLRVHHDSPVAGYFGVMKTFDLLHRK